MNDVSIFIGGVGGQGLVLMTKILSEAVAEIGFDVKTNDVVGLSQRGGKIWGSVKFGNKIYSPNILPSKADYIVGLEPLEAYRWLNLLKQDGTCIINTSRIYPTMVTMEKMEYPENIESAFSNKGNLISVDATDKSREFGNSKVANALILGILAKSLDENYKLETSDFYTAIKNSIEKNAPSKALDLNFKVFDYGYNY